MSDGDCGEPGCGCGAGAASISRRGLLKLAGAGAAVGLLPNWPVMAGPFIDADFAKLIPSDKKLKPEWLASLTARGEPEVYRGSELRYIGMPVGGLFCGTLYLGGDGRLWLWDIFNRNQLGVRSEPVEFHGERFDPIRGSAYVMPLAADEYHAVEQGFTLHIRSGQTTIVRSLDVAGFADVSFCGQYPIGMIRYADAAVPVAVQLEAFSPFIPLNAADSSLPATILSFRVQNTSNSAVEVELTGTLENAVSRPPQYWTGMRCNQVLVGDGVTLLLQSVRESGETLTPRSDIVFEDWSKPAYEGWKVQGEAFGKGPIDRDKMPAYQGKVGGDSQFVVNSHATAPGTGVGGRDGATGRLTSQAFTISRRFISFWIGGGNHPGHTCLNLLVDGSVVCTQTGRDENKMFPAWFDVRQWEGREAHIEIVDAEIGTWGNVGVGKITFGDRPIGAADPAEQGDFGTMCLALLGAPAQVQSGAAEVPLESRLVGGLGRRVNIDAGQSVEIVFVIAWHMPNVGILPNGKRHYSARFGSAADVVRYIAEHYARLAGTTRRWRDTWYDSTLPHWLLNRTFANTSTLATTTCHRFADGRFWAWEGVGCCAGTCTHVWHYAQAMARLFPEVERDQRERVDFGLAMQEDGSIRFRAEHGDRFAIDGQAGRILGAYREHQMSPDAAFLKRVWPRVRKAIERMMQTDAKRNGLVLGPLHNTLDADWFGTVPWLCGLYHAALRAGEVMAGEVGDGDFAAICRKILDQAARNLDATCWNEDYQYYVHRGDSAHPKEVGAYDGCHIDQVLGQGWARQVALGDVMTPAHVKAALQSLWKYNFTPDVGPFRNTKPAGRWYALAGDGGTIMVSYPFRATSDFAGSGAWSAMYFNECMSGFEHQAASHMLWEGLLTEGLATTRVIHDRYHPRLRNPYNEIECSDHYARAMASYGTYLAACGFECHGPQGHIGFAPRITPEDFRAAFTSAEGWGTYAQQRCEGDTLHASLEIRYGRLRLRTLRLAWPWLVQPRRVQLESAGKNVVASLGSESGYILIRLAEELTLGESQRLTIVVS